MCYVRGYELLKQVNMWGRVEFHFRDAFFWLIAVMSNNVIVAMKHFEQFSHKTFVQLDTVGEAAKKTFYVEEFDLLTKCKFFNTILLSSF